MSAMLFDPRWLGAPIPRLAVAVTKRWRRLLVVPTAPHIESGGLDALDSLQDRLEHWASQVLQIVAPDRRPELREGPPRAGCVVAVRYFEKAFVVFAKIRDGQVSDVLARAGRFDDSVLGQLAFAESGEHRLTKEVASTASSSVAGSAIDWERGPSLCPVQWLESEATRTWLEKVYTRGWGHGLELVEAFAEGFGSSLAAVDWAHGVLGLAARTGEEKGCIATLRLLASVVPPGSTEPHDAAVVVLGRTAANGWVTTDHRPDPRAYYQTLPQYRHSAASYRYEPQVDDAIAAKFPPWVAEIRERFPWGVSNVRRRLAAEGRT